MKYLIQIITILVFLPLTSLCQMRTPPGTVFQHMIDGGLSIDSLGMRLTSITESKDGNIGITAFAYMSHLFSFLSDKGDLLTNRASTNQLYGISMESSIPLPSGNTVFLGINHFGLISRDGLIFGYKTDYSGNIVDSFDDRTIENWINQNYIRGITSHDNHIYIVGTSYSQDTINGQAYLPASVVKVDSNGRVLWKHFYSPSNKYYVQDFYDAIDYDNKLLILSHVLDDSTNASGYNIVTVDTSGNKISEYPLQFDTSLNYQCITIFKTNDNNILISGFVGLGKPRTYYGFLSKFTPSGDSIWTTYVQQDGYTLLNDVCELPNGDLVACGQAYHKYTDSLGNPKENNDLYLAVFDKNGTLKKEYRWGTDFKDELSRILLLRDGNIVVGGSTGMETTPDNTYIRGGEAYIAKIQTASLSTPREVHTTSNLSVYPNPSSETITVSGLTKSSYTIVNILGAEVTKGSTNEGNATIDVRSLPNGIYYFIEKRSGTPTRVPFVIAR